MDACIKETLRLIPPASFTFLRQATNDHKIGNLNIKKGTYVRVPIASLLSGKGLTNENKFIPERWLNGEMDKIDNICKISFSSGPKNCIGQHLAEFEAKIITIIFLRRF